MPVPLRDRAIPREQRVAALRMLFATRRLRPCLGRRAVAALVAEVAAEQTGQPPPLA